MNWIIENKEWVFSGIGVFVISTIIGVFFCRKSSKQIQKSGDNSKNYQASGDINIGINND